MDLITRLKSQSACEPGCEGRCKVCPDDTAKEAAAEIERLTAEVERLRAVLGEIIDLDHHNHGPESRATTIARNALNQRESIERTGGVGWAR